MKYAVAPEQRRFFERHHSIVFEGLLSQEQVAALKAGIIHTLGLRLDVREEELHQATAQQIFTAGHDIWRTHASVKKIALQQALGELMYELCDERPIRIAYDQLLPALRNVPFRGAEPKTYADLIVKEATLESISSVQGILGGIFICIEPPHQPLEGWPAQPGDALIASKEYWIHLHKLQELSGALFYLLAYSKDKGVYVLKPADPHTHALKQAGYIIGDRLIEKLNPIVYR